jgi:UDP-N-acetylmuramoylalanine--D-glutamate ligase
LAIFSGIEHRIERVKIAAPYTIYNDSKSTNPESAIIALRSFKTPCHLILGGYEKGLNMASLWDEIKKSSVKKIYVFGQCKNRFYAELTAILPSEKIIQADDLNSILDAVLFHVKPNDIVLFSPATSSFDQYKNFEDRGRAFKALLQEKIE